MTYATILKKHKWTMMTLGSQIPRQHAKYLILRPCRHLPVFMRAFAWGMAIYWWGCSGQRSYEDRLLDFKLPSQCCVWSGSDEPYGMLCHIMLKLSYTSTWTKKCSNFHTLTCGSVYCVMNNHIAGGCWYQKIFSVGFCGITKFYHEHMGS